MDEIIGLISLSLLLNFILAGCQIFYIRKKSHKNEIKNTAIKFLHWLVYCSLVYFYLKITILPENMITLFFLVTIVILIQYALKFAFSCMNTNISAWNFLKDSLKKDAILFILGIPTLIATLFLIENHPEHWALWSALAVALFLSLKALYEIFIADLILLKFNSITDGELSASIQLNLKSTQFPLDRIYLIEDKRKKRDINARVSGAGKFNRILLTNELTQHLTADEVAAVIAHEIGHAKLHHQVIYYFLEVLLVTFFVYLLGFLLQVNNFSRFTAIPLIIALFPVIYFYLLPGLNTLKRYFETEADEFALQCVSPALYRLTLTKIFNGNESLDQPHPFYYFWYYSHPTPSARLDK